MNTDSPDLEQYGERALPELLRERWSIQSTVPAVGGTYVVLVRDRNFAPGEADEPPSSRSAALG